MQQKQNKRIEMLRIELSRMDFSAIEARLAARFKERGDLHAQRAAEHFGVPLSEVTPDMRRVGKLLNHFRVYGGTNAVLYLEEKKDDAE